MAKDSLGVPNKSCPICGIAMAITTEETDQSREAHYACPEHGKQLTISTNLQVRKKAK